MCEATSQATDVEVLVPEYASPVFRFGKIYEYLKNVDSKKAVEVANGLRNKIDYIIDDLLRNQANFGLAEGSVSKDSSINCEMTKANEGIIILLPEIYSKLLNGYRVIIRISMTICLPPKHSKIWIRVSYLKEDSESLSECDLQTFFYSAKSVSVELARFMKKFYQEALEENGVSSGLVKRHEIRISAAAANLGKTAISIRSGKFKRSDILSNLELVRVLKGISGRFFDEEIQLEELYASASWTTKPSWINITDLTNIKLIGLCSQISTNDSTDFICLMHSDTPSDSYEVTKQGTKWLLLQIASNL